MDEIFESGVIGKPWGSLEGRMLVASKSLDGSCFEKSLIYICAHDENGAIGVIINREMGSISLKEIFESQRVEQKQGIPARLNKRFPVLFGGPVETSRVIILSMNRDQEEHFTQWHSLTVHTDAENFLHDYVKGSHNNKFVVTQGLAAWDGDQLEHELSENAWLVMDLDDPKLIFSQRTKNKWKKAIEALGVRNFDNLVSYSGHA